MAPPSQDNIMCLAVIPIRKTSSTRSSRTGRVGAEKPLGRFACGDPLRGDAARATLLVTGEVFPKILRVGVGECEDAAAGPRTEVFFLIDNGSTVAAEAEVDEVAGLGVESSWSAVAKGIRLPDALSLMNHGRNASLRFVFFKKKSRRY